MADSEVIVVVEIQEILDEDAFAAYRASARQQLLERGGSLVARGGNAFEGDPPMGTLLIQRWPSEAAFRDWQRSDAYRPLREVRLKAARLRISVVEAA